MSELIHKISLNKISDYYDVTLLDYFSSEKKAKPLSRTAKFLVRPRVSRVCNNHQHKQDN